MNTVAVILLCVTLGWLIATPHFLISGQRRRIKRLEDEVKHMDKGISRLYRHINEINGGPVALPDDPPDPNIWVRRADTNTFTDGKP